MSPQLNLLTRIQPSSLRLLNISLQVFKVQNQSHHSNLHILVSNNPNKTNSNNNPVILNNKDPSIRSITSLLR